MHTQVQLDLRLADLRLGCAYELGRSLCYTAWPASWLEDSYQHPDRAPDLLELRAQFSWRRLMTLNRLLADLSYDLGRDLVTAVMDSLQNWSSFLDGIPLRDSKDPSFVSIVQLGLQEQCQLWHDLLAGLRPGGAAQDAGSGPRSGQFAWLGSNVSAPDRYPSADCVAGSRLDGRALCRAIRDAPGGLTALGSAVREGRSSGSCCR